MNRALTYSLLSICFLLPLGTSAAPTDGTTPPEVITRLVANASKNPPGPVENDVAAQTVQNANAAKEMFSTSVRATIALTYNEFTLEGPLTSLYLEGSAAIFYGKVRLTDNALADYKEDTDSTTLVVNGKPVVTSTDGSAMFSELGFSKFVGPKVRDDGHVIATFCLIQQHGLWKVFGLYLSNEPIQGHNKDFLISHLAAFAKKS